MKNYSRNNKESVTQEDMDRIADILDKDSRYNKWDDEEGFNRNYNDYLAGTKVNNSSTRKKVFKRYKSNPLIRGQHKRIVMFNERQEKTLKKYEKGQVPRGRREQPARIITKYKGKKARVRTFNILARQKGKTVYARRIKTKVGVRYVTKQGWLAKRL